MLTHQDLLNDYLYHHILRPKTEDAYREAIRKLQKNIATPIELLTFDELLIWRKKELKKGLAPTSWNTYTRHLKALFNHGINQGILPYEKNPFSALFVREGVKQKKRLSREQIEQTRTLFNTLERLERDDCVHNGIYPAWFWRTIFETFYYTGMRRNQLLHLKQKDVDFEHGQIFLCSEGSKGHRELYIPMVKQLVDWLTLLFNRMPQDAKNPDRQLFAPSLFNPRVRRETLGENQINACFRALSMRLGFKISPHRFRHTLGSDLVNKHKSNLFLVKELMGHTDIRTTVQYLEADQQAIRAMLNNREDETSTQLDLF